MFRFFALFALLLICEHAPHACKLAEFLVRVFGTLAFRETSDMVPPQEETAAMPCALNSYQARVDS
jgi:hypothetical protein